jgi:hypothetical protein
MQALRPLSVSASLDLVLAHPRMARLQGTRELVTLIGGEHELSASSSTDVLSWSVTFLDALVRGTPSARDIDHDGECDRRRR